jgi:hypothetical protein
MGEADAIAERRRHRLVDEADPAHSEPAEHVLHFRAIHLERRHRRRHGELAHPLACRAFDLAQQLAQERLGGIAGAEALASEARQRP